VIGFLTRCILVEGYRATGDRVRHFTLEIGASRVGLVTGVVPRIEGIADGDSFLNISAGIPPAISIPMAMS
jgi:hypothetical protein